MVKNAPLYDKPSRALALEKLTDFIPKAGLSYRNKRNYDFGPSNHNHVSQLSPFIRRRIVTESEVLKVAWPHATHGFFRFQEKIPALINELGLIS